MNNTDRALPPRVLVAISNIDIGGGAEKVATAVANALLARGIPTTLLTFYTTDHEHNFNGERVSMHEATPASLLGKIPRAWLRIRSVKRVCEERSVDVVVSFLEESNYYVLLSKILLLNRTPMIVSVRNDPRRYSWLYKLLIRVLYPRAETVVAVTKAVEESLRNDFGLTNVVTIYNPIDRQLIAKKAAEPLPPEYAWIAQRSPLCISIGRLTRQKGQWHLVRAFTQVRERHPTATLVILGDGQYRTKLERLIADCDLADNVFLLGRHVNVYPFLATADIFVFSSLWEGMPNTVLEALALGLPIVAADCDGGPREIIAPEIVGLAHIAYPYKNINGVLTSPFDSEEIWETPAEVSLLSQEVHVAEAIIDTLNTQTTGGGASVVASFAPNKIIDTWYDVLISSKK